METFFKTRASFSRYFLPNKKIFFSANSASLRLLLAILLIMMNDAFAANDLGKQDYEKACHLCHNPSTAPLMKAPPAHDVAAWKVRFDTAKVTSKKEDVIPVLIETVKRGKGAMPPGGMCQDCRDEDYRAAIKYMSSEEEK
jgi:cytochrome c5